MFVWSVAPTYTSIASKKSLSFDSLGFNAWRNALSLIMLVPIALFAGFPHGVPLTNPIFQMYMVMGSVMGGVLGDTLLVYSISRAGAALAVPISYLYVVWVALIGYVVGRGGAEALLASFIAALGIWVVYYAPSTTRDPLGLSAALGSSLSWTIGLYSLDRAADKLMGIDPLYASVSMALLRSCYSLLALAYHGLKWYRGFREVVWETVAASISGYVIGYFALSAALVWLEAWLVGVILAGIPVVTAFLSKAMAGEAVSRRMFLGTILISVAIALAFR